jgi:hypothetical protein
MKRFPLYEIFLVIICFVFFYPFILKGNIPIPADTIVGMYHPWRDNIWDGLTAGVPYKNFLITDPVRQQYVWREYAIDQLQHGHLPLWNPYSFSGMPLVANIQSAVFYPLNSIFFILPFSIAWGILVMSQTLCMMVFFYWYMRILGIQKAAGLIGAIAWGFSGFSIAWLEWNTILHTAMWLPLILLLYEKILKNFKFKWMLLLIFAHTSQILAGHLQVLFYSLLISTSYVVVRMSQYIKRDKKQKGVTFIRLCTPFVSTALITAVLTFPQWWPAFSLIKESARTIDQGAMLPEGWFIPWQNLIQFVVPDYFGNPSTGNYWGIWNYAEFVGFIGIIPLILAIYSLIFRRDRKVLFFGTLCISALLFALPTVFAKIPFILHIPLISTSQPTRLLFIIDFCLCILASFGFDQFEKEKRYLPVLSIISMVSIAILAGWSLIFIPHEYFPLVTMDMIRITAKNLIYPTLIFGSSIIALVGYVVIRARSRYIVLVAIIGLILVDVLRFGWKFTPFSPAEWIYPSTKLISLIQADPESYRMMATDRRIIPANFSVKYRIQDVSGYDPLYLTRYSQIAAAWDRGTSDISPASFNRIITPSQYNRFFADLLGVKYIMTFGPVESNKLRYLAKEGQTYLYENTSAFPRAFFVDDFRKVASDQQAIDMMYQLGSRLRTIAVVTDNILVDSIPLSQSEFVKISSYQPDSITINTTSNTIRLMVLSDIYYPTWEVRIDGKKSSLLRVDLSLRGVVVPPGTHVVEFKDHLL